VAGHMVHPQLKLKILPLLLMLPLQMWTSKGGCVSSKGGSVSGRGGSVSSRGGSVSSRGGSESSRGGSVSGRGSSVSGRGSSVSSRDGSKFRFQGGNNTVTPPFLNIEGGNIQS
jgi:hypothetical protein